MIQIDTRPINNREYVVWSDFTYGTPTERITIKKGFVTDLASVPKWAWGIGNFKPDGLHRTAAVIHDALYQLRGYVSIEYPMVGFYKLEPILGVDEEKSWARKELRIDRKECDNIFKQVMMSYNSDPFTCNTMYNMVRIFGRFAW